MSTKKGMRLVQAIATGSLLAGLIAAPPAAGAQLAAVQDDVVRLTNAERQKAGCPPLTAVAELNRAAQSHTDDMAAHNFMDHKGSDGSSVTTRAERSGYTGWSNLAENVAAGQQTADAVVSAWLNSAKHRENMLNCQLKDIGVGYAANPNTTYGTFWTQDFGLR